MKQVLVLGAGMVARPLVHYLLDQNYEVVLGDLNLEQARDIIGDHSNGCALALDGGDRSQVEARVVEADLVVSLLPPSFHLDVARTCLRHGKHFLSASYLNHEMEALDAEAKSKGLIFLNEIGLDPGLDHLTAMEIIDDLKQRGYRILGFDSHCGGIPNRTASYNPLRYKLSWNPSGVLGAITRPSKFLKDGRLTVVPGKDMLRHIEVLRVPGAGVFESSPNSDSLFYGRRYGLKHTRTIRRGTLRYPGWAAFWLFMISLDFLDAEHEQSFDNEPVLSALFKLRGQTPPPDIYEFVHLQAPEHTSECLEKMDELGLLDPNIKISGTYTAFKILLERAEASLRYKSGERDLVILHHEFFVEKDGQREKWTSTLMREGTEEASAMAFLVGLPAAIAARLILEDRLHQRGVLIPLDREFYQPILKELAALGLPHTVLKQPISTNT